jgi:hypothetical protein
MTLLHKFAAGKIFRLLKGEYIKNTFKDVLNPLNASGNYIYQLS